MRKIPRNSGSLPLFFDLTDSALLPGVLPSSLDLREPGRFPDPERGDADSVAAASSASRAAASSACRRSSCIIMEPEPYDVTIHMVVNNSNCHS